MRSLLDEAARCRTADPMQSRQFALDARVLARTQFAADAGGRGAVPPGLDRPPAWPLRVRVRARHRGGRSGGTRRSQPDAGVVAPPARRGPLPGEQLPRCARALSAGAGGVPGDRPRCRRGTDPAHRGCDLSVDGRLRPGDLDLRDRVGRQRGPAATRRRRDGARESRAHPRSAGRTPRGGRSRSACDGARPPRRAASRRQPARRSRRGARRARRSRHRQRMFRRGSCRLDTRGWSRARSCRSPTNSV